MSKARQNGLKAYVKNLFMRAMRPGLAPLHARLDRLEAELGLARQRAAKDRGELDYWRWLIKRGGSEKQHGEPFAVVFGRWQRHRLLKLAEYLGLPQDDRPGNIDEWCRARSVVEIGAGPYPAVAAAKKGWKRCVAVDPLARGYVEEGLLPPACEGVTYIEAQGEDVPLPSNFADLVVCENCLDHVSDPAAVVREMHRLLKPGGLVWFFVDLSDHRDYMHPHPMTEARVRELFEGFVLVGQELTPHKAHPKAHSGLRALLRKPAHAPEPAVVAPPRPATRGGVNGALPPAPRYALDGQGDAGAPVAREPEIKVSNGRAVGAPGR
jgi:SAM-dependent methyltransferase